MTVITRTILAILLAVVVLAINPVGAHAAPRGTETTKVCAESVSNIGKLESTTSLKFYRATLNTKECTKVGIRILWSNSVTNPKAGAASKFTWPSLFNMNVGEMTITGSGVLRFTWA